jgi:hypothetical protein
LPPEYHGNRNVIRNLFAHHGSLRMTAIGLAAFLIGLFGVWLDIDRNGVTGAEWAGLMLSMATLGAVLMGVEYLRS